MKTICTACLALLCYIHVAAQSNFYKLGVGGGFGVTQSFTDVRKHDFGLAGYLVADYYFTPYINAGIEGQMGEINGGDVNNDPYHRQFINSYKTFTLNAKLFLGAITEYERGSFLNSIKGLYIGSGVGVVQNKMRGIVRVIPESNPQEIYPGKDESKNLLFPFNLGINFYFQDRSGFQRYVLNFNYQSNVVLGEGLDGYDDSSIKFRNGNPDIYTYFSVGIRYHFGPVGLYKKTFL